MTRLILPIFVFALVCLAFAGDVIACSCGDRPTVDEQLERYSGDSNVVVTGRIESVQKIREEEREYDHDAYRSATLVVEKVYFGNVKVGDRLLLAQGNGADCAFTWRDSSVGSRWLFYLGKPTTRHYQYMEDAEKLSESDKISMYATSNCGRSIWLEGGARDIAYLEKIAKVKGKTRVSGDLAFGDRSVEGIEVRFTGKDIRLKTKYIKDGYFELYDVPPGEYLLEVIAPFGWKVVDHWRYYRRGPSEFDAEDLAKLKKNQRYIRVVPGGHTDIDLGLAPDTQVSGLVISPTGKPMPNVYFSLERVGGNKDERAPWSTSNEKGEFKFETLGPGNYFLIVNPSGKIDGQQAFGKFFYPGAESQEMAGVISVEAGKYNTGIEVQIPQLARLIDVSGRVHFADDKPIKWMRVEFTPADADRFAPITVQADQDGRFQMKIPFGAAGTLQGSTFFSEYQYSQCPKIMEVTKAAGSSNVKTTAFQITGTEPSITATLRLPVDFCENKKK